MEKAAKCKAYIDGEIEARDAANRLNLTAEERQNTRPDIDRTDVVFADGGVSYSLKVIPSRDEMQKKIVAVADMDIVATMTGNEFAKGPVDLVTQVSDYFNSIGNTISNEYGEFILDKAGAKASLGHGMGRPKAIAYMAVPFVLEKGKIIDFQQNWKNRGYDTAVFAAPVEIADNRYYEAVVVDIYPDSNRYYLHEVLIEKEGAEGLFKTGIQNAISAPSNPSAPIFSLLQQIRDVNSNSSKSTGSQEGTRNSLKMGAVDEAYMAAVERRPGDRRAGAAVRGRAEGCGKVQRRDADGRFQRGADGADCAGAAEKYHKNILYYGAYYGNINKMNAFCGKNCEG